MDTIILRPTRSPWGNVDNTEELAKGVFLVSTPSHGGVMVHRKAQDTPEGKLTAQALSKSEQFGDWACFEEDCRINIFFFEHPDLLRAHKGRCAKDWQLIVDGAAGWSESIRREAPEALAKAARYLRMTDSRIRSSLVPDITVFDADYLLERGLEVDADMYRRYLNHKAEERLRKSKSHNLIVCAWGDWHTERPGVI